MTTVSLELSRQLQERWPEWETEHYLRLHKPNGATELYTASRMHYDNQRFYNSVAAERFRAENEFYISPHLDELRVFALELIGKEPPFPASTSFGDELWQEWTDKIDELKDVLIQGCDSTAVWLLNTFGQGGQESE